MAPPIGNLELALRAVLAKEIEGVDHTDPGERAFEMLAGFITGATCQCVAAISCPGYDLYLVELDVRAVSGSLDDGRCSVPRT